MYDFNRFRKIMKIKKSDIIYRSEPSDSEITEELNHRLKDDISAYSRLFKDKYYPKDCLFDFEYIIDNSKNSTILNEYINQLSILYIQEIREILKNTIYKDDFFEEYLIDFNINFRNHIENLSKNDTLVIVYNKVSWRNINGKLTIDKKNVLEKLSINGDYNIQYYIKNNKIILTRYSHDEPTGATFRIITLHKALKEKIFTKKELNIEI